MTFALDPGRVGWVIASLILAGADQVIKRIITEVLPLCSVGRCESIVLLPVLQFMRFHNDGAAFSFLASAGGWQRWVLLAMSSVVSLFIAIWLLRTKEANRVLTIALTLILGGALGNLVDRALLGYVVDFVLVHYEDWYFPAFNLADSCISVGAGFLILDMFMTPRAAGEVHEG